MPAEAFLLVAVLVFAMFAIAAVALSLALRVKLAGGREPLSRNARWWVRGLTLGVIVALVVIVMLFQRAFAV